MSERIALIGLGAMGGAIGTRLLETGNRLHVFDLDREKVAALVARGAIAADSAAGASRVRNSSSPASIRRRSSGWRLLAKVALPRAPRRGR